jgi:hypothetical protein
MAGYIGWHDVYFGARNVRDGECDIARNLLIWVGIPVAFVFRGGFHRIEVARVRDPREQARLRQFLCSYFGWPPEQARAFRDTVDIPLKHRAALGWMAGLGALVVIALIPTLFSAVFLPLAFLHLGQPRARVDVWLLVVAAVSPLVLVVGLALYRRLRLPSPRQAGIRAAVARRVGTFADLADWKVASLGPLFPLLGIVSLEPADVLADAENYRSADKLDDALVRARIALAFARSGEEDHLIERAELLTDDCVARLEGAGA